MKKAIKILLLFFAIVAIVIGILYYYKTIVSPPQNLKFNNKHFDNVMISSSQFEKLKEDKSRDTLFFSLCDKTKLYLKEGYIDSNERDKLINIITNNYLPLFINSCFSKFEKPVWYKKDHQNITQQINEIKSLTIKDGSVKLVQGESEQKLNNILTVIDQYNKAVYISNNTNFNSIDKAKNVIVQAKKYTGMRYLKNCKDLVNKLNNVPKKIEESHIAYLKNEVNKLSNYQNLKEERFDQLMQEVYSTIKEYKDNAPIVYGYSSDGINEINSLAGKYYQQAKDYYESIRTRIINNPEYMITNEQYEIVRIELATKYTKINLKYTNAPSFLISFQISKEIYIECDGEKYSFKRSDQNEIIEPEMFSLNPEDIIDFSLFFDPIPKNTNEFILKDPNNSDLEFVSIKLN